MRRSICQCEPSTCLAGQIDTRSFIYTSAVSLPKGTKIKFDLVSEGRSVDWEIPDSDLTATENVIYAMLEDGVPIELEEIEKSTTYVPDYEFTLSEKVPAGGTITIVMGAPKPKGKAKPKPEKGNQAQTFTQRRKPFYLYIDTSGKGRYGDPELFLMDIRGSELHHIHVMTPSFVMKNRRFDVTVRFEDEFGNLTDNAPEETMIELSHEHLRENLSWKLFLPETGYLHLPNLYFNETGIYTIQLKNLHTDEYFTSPPIKCISEMDEQLLWGTIHGESERADSVRHIEHCLRHFRDELFHKFYVSSPFEKDEETTADMWKQMSQQLSDFEEEDRFAALSGYQWQGKDKTEGTRLMIHSKDVKNIMRSSDGKYNTLKKIYSNQSSKDVISVPTFTMGKGSEYNFENFNPEFERVVEIYNSWGSSECSAKDGNTCPIESSGKKGVSEGKEGSIIKALQNNCRFGFVAGGLDDRGPYENFYEEEQVQYPSGITGLLAKSHNRQGIFEALYNRRCYATTGERIIVGMNIAGATMGQELDTTTKPGLMVNRHIACCIAGTTDIAYVELIQNGKVLHKVNGNGYHLNFEYDDMVPLDKIALKGKGKEAPFTFYYLRVVQEDGHMAWGSPIWIDLTPKKKK